MRDRGGYGGYGYGGIALPRLSPTVLAIIIITFAVFVVQLLVGGFARRDLGLYLGVQARAVVERLWVWQILTYMFLHDPYHLLHIFFNMFCLYLFGSEVERLVGRRRFLTIYFGGGILGGLTYCVTQYVAGVEIPAIGASAAAIAVLVVYALYLPNHTVLFMFLFPMKVKWAVAILVGFDLLYSLTQYADGVAHTAHLGGALFGVLYWRFYSAVAGFFDRIEDRHREREAKRVADDERRMDEILAKISREGFDSLTRREREFLNEQSRRRRERGYRG